MVPEPSFELSLLEASEGRLAGPASDVEAEYDAGVSEPPEARSLTEVAHSVSQKLLFKDIIVKDLIELDSYGYNDDYSIELSSDEEEAPEDRVRLQLS